MCGRFGVRAITSYAVGDAASGARYGTCGYLLIHRSPPHLLGWYAASADAFVSALVGIKEDRCVGRSRRVG
jgi:hypothetical protein